jgi:hypothetical protein
VTHLTYWWKGDLNADGEVVREVRNWGDLLNWTLLNAMGALPAWRAPEEAEMVVVGSILEHLPSTGWAGVVCGAGMLRPESTMDVSNATVLAVRGRLTAERLIGLNPDKPPVFGDPALLMPRFVRQYQAKFDVGILPHWSDTTLRSRYPYGHFINPFDRPEVVVETLAKCKRIITSSLHGMIVADAYGIPRQVELFPGAENEGGDFKYRDYSTIYGDDNPHIGEMWTAPFHVVERVQVELLRALETALGLQDVLGVPQHDFRDHTKWHHRGRKRRPQISLLVPFRDDGEQRVRTWHWLLDYWMRNLDSVEVVEGHTASIPFNKSQAVNAAACHARGRVFVILDADIYMDANVIQGCADRIDFELGRGNRKWFMPYDHFYRLTQEATTDLMATDSSLPYNVSSPPPESWIMPGNPADYGHQYGAGIMVMPREAFFLVNGMDPRFNRGWGSEDGSMLRALDTLYCQHEVVHKDVLHFWHTRPGHNYLTRRWVGQIQGVANSRLAQRYAQATGDVGWMRSLVDGHIGPVALPDRCSGDDHLRPLGCGRSGLPAAVVHPPAAG